jgi:hypothetical protein
VNNAANNILGKIESINVPDPVYLGFDPAWGALSKKRFVVLSSFGVGSLLVNVTLQILDICIRWIVFFKKKVN